jgi:hypothetical protein
MYVTKDENHTLFSSTLEEIGHRVKYGYILESQLVCNSGQVNAIDFSDRLIVR